MADAVCVGAPSPGAEHGARGRDGVVLEVDGLETVFGGERRFLRPPRPLVRAVSGVTFGVRRGEALGVVGESGCGKTTLGRTILGLQREAAGTIRLDGAVVSGRPRREARRVRRAIQYVHQDAAAALDPWWSVGLTIEEALVVAGVATPAERPARIDRVLSAVGLDLTVKRRYPHELSGGQLRRVTLARVLVLEPRLVILDEPTSGLDLSVQATVLRLLRDLRERLGLTYVFISHDLSVVRQMCDRVAIMYLGRIVETAETSRIFEAPAHPYTRLLLSAAPTLSTGQTLEAATIPGEPPSPTAVPSGCAFRPRCGHAVEACANAVPALEPVPAGGAVACHRWREIAGAPPAPVGLTRRR
jgi:oligopeptide/dipeptide ABC transporter ATP-binding protein